MSLERKRSQRFHQQRSDCQVQAVAGDSLAVAVINPIHLARALADVDRSEARFALAITDSHSASAYSADGQPLQQRWTFPSRAALFYSLVRRIFLKTAEILLVRLPSDIAGMRIQDQSVPFLPGQGLN